MILNKTEKDICTTQDKIISDCNEYRAAWAKEAAEVDLAIRGILNPVNNGKGEYKNAKGQEPKLNLIERQYRNMLTYISGNKPSIDVHAKLNMSDVDVDNSKKLLKHDFIDSNFYRDKMDDITYYGFRRGIIYTITIIKEGELEDFALDPMDTFVDTNTNKKDDVRAIVSTFTRTLNELKNTYETNYKGELIDWKKVAKEKEKTKSDEKRLILEPSDKDVYLLRQGFYLDFKGGKQVLVRVLSTLGVVLERQIYENIDFLPVTYFAPILDPDRLYNESWFKKMLYLERAINKILTKFIHINEIGGRQVFVREGTRMAKGSDRAMASLGIEVIQIGKSQEIPQPVELLKISNADMALLQFLIDQAEETGGIRQEAMGSTKLGADASGTAIEKLAAGSYANVGMAVNELNKFMNRLGEIHFKLHKNGNAEKIKYFDYKNKIEIKIDSNKLGTPLLQIEPKSSFSSVMEKADAIEMINKIATTDPSAKISADIWGEVYGQNELGKKILRDMNAQKDPNLAAAEASIQLLLAGQEPAVSPTDDHQTNMALIGKALQTAGEQLPEQIRNNMITKFNKHKAFAGGNPAEDEHRQ